MDKKGESNLKLEILEEKCEKLKKEFSEQKQFHFFDMLIDCGSIILPAHKFVLCSRSDVLAQQLSPDVNELNWTDYGADFGIALLRWIYTNKLDFNNVTLPPSASYQFPSTTLFVDWEDLLSLVNEGTDEETIIKYHNIGKMVGSDRLVAKCLELQPNCLFNSVVKSQVKLDHKANTNLHGSDIYMEVDTEIEQRVNDLAEEVKKFEKISIGCREFGTFSDLTVSCGYSPDWPGHKYFLSNRSTEFRDEILHAESSRLDFLMDEDGSGSSRPAFWRWLYTGFLELESVDMACGMLYRSRKYNLPTLLEQCDEASQKIVDISSCAQFHELATRMGATKILERCQELIKSYGKVLQSEGSLKMDVDLDNSSENSICEGERRELPLEGAGGFLNLNDDCLLHLFRYLPLVDLGSIKDTCKRMSQLADQSFKLRKDKSITIQRCSMLVDIWNLTHFGKLMNSLTVRSIYKEFASCNEIFQMIAKYSNEQLKSFTVHLDHLDLVADESLPCLQKVLRNVETIKLLSSFNGINNGCIKSLLEYCENVRDVNIESGNYFLRLEQKLFWCPKIANITCLTLNCVLQDEQILGIICEKLTHLECFEFFSYNVARNNISRLSQLDHLKRLKIRCLYYKIGNALQTFAEKNHLEYLCLKDVTICEALVHTLGHFENLKELVFEDVYDFDGNAKNILSKSLANVEKLAFVGYGSEDGPRYDFEGVIQIVENLTNLKELSVTGRYYSETVISRNNYLRLRKKRNLKIFLQVSTYKRSIEWIANDLSNYVRLTARPQEFFDKLCYP